MENLGDLKLIKQYLAGDEKSLDVLVKRYLKIIYGYSYRNVGNSADAEDITQETFLKVWKNIKKFDQSKSFKSWIFTIAKNTSIDYLRKKKSVPFSRFETTRSFVERNGSTKKRNIL
jgi:RNA polymerase sigma-70 factor (ECF subfamily)